MLRAYVLDLGGSWRIDEPWHDSGDGIVTQLDKFMHGLDMHIFGDKNGTVPSCYRPILDGSDGTQISRDGLGFGEEMLNQIVDSGNVLHERNVSNFRPVENEESNENSSEDVDYEVGPDYAQSEDDLNVGDAVENHLKGLGKKHLDIDIGDVAANDYDSDFIAQDSSSEDEDEVANGSMKKFHKQSKRFRKTKLLELPKFRAAVDMAKPVFKLGLSFPSGGVFKQAVRESTIQNGKDIWLKNNDPHRIRAQCKGVNCPWVCFASKIDDSLTFVIKIYVGEHKCSRKNTNRFATSKWLGQKYLNEFKMNDKWAISSFIHKVSKDHVIDISRDTAYRARLKAIRTIEGSYEEQYDALWDYEEIKWTNKGSTIEFMTDPGDSGKPRFKRLYICYAGLKQGFNNGCRLVIGLDGCHIKGVHPGQLLMAVGIDANNQMYHIAFAVDLNIENSNRWSFITDKRKGLEQALKGMWDKGIPEAEHRHCARHLEKNFNKVFRDKILKDILWKAAREVIIRRFEAAMSEIKIVNKDTFNWLMAVGPHH
ncbi:uncharacterized protein LOC133795629 [Humulus lupulus]|uniref:uncharacterized protein LOC133795629 n=1 Tax=Humulus lupulus TaxID=3486 RepID=UPI002B40E7D1|nr:uncharacterized protein LOC133795629 [Humulus lupulus]